MSRWTVYMKRADFKAVADRFHISPITARLIRNRDITDEAETEKYLHGSLKDMYSHELMRDIGKAAGILCGKIDNHARIRVIGDYDVDGIMSTYILIRGLRRAGADADYRVPSRISDGYGVNADLINDAYTDGIDTVVTCDNGIAAREAVDRAKELGMTVIVTDHHEVPFEIVDGIKAQLIPDADAVVDPKRDDCTYPYDELCGASVAWKLICAIYEIRNIPEDEAMSFLPYAACATIADVCSLTDENRIIVREGLKMLKDCDNTGLMTLIKRTGLSPDQIDVYHIGFIIGPCLNASGRLETAAYSIELLLTEDSEEAVRLSDELINLNEIRKKLTERGVNEAVRIIESGEMRKVTVVYLEDCHESVAGIIAGRIREKYYRPCFILTKGEDGLKGSGRSIDEYDMYAEMSRCSGLFLKFGGHTMAAGLSMKTENLDEFIRTINENCTLTDEDMERKVKIDMELPLEYVTKKLVGETEMLKPFGKGNPGPLFAVRDVRINDPRIVGRNRNVLNMKITDGRGHTMNGVCFNNAERFYEDALAGKELTIAFYPSVNVFRGVESLQLTVVDYII